MSTAFEKEIDFYTYADYLAWDTEDRYEIIDGIAYMMSAPTVTHQAISGELLGQFWSFLRGKPCRVFAAPLDVRLFPRDDEGDDTIVQPDLLVICDKAKLADVRSCRGAPDLVVEILSPSNTNNAMLLKFGKYLEAGVREYWIINPVHETLQVHLLDKGDEDPIGRYLTTVYKRPAAMDVTILPGLRIDFSAIWTAPPTAPETDTPEAARPLE
ncbi:MAG: Uma2 family endonuclease [Treponema sp.]|jgi:Uma2 family endonuclease|nr:Uma2 family endonuclease [Treponema sp.]